MRAFLSVLFPGPLLVGSVQWLSRTAPAALEEEYPWACKNGDALRTGSSEYVVTSAIENGPTWSFHEECPLALSQHPQFATLFPDWKGLIRAAPLIDDQGSLYLATVTLGNVYKFAPNGTQIWKHNAGPFKQIPDIPALMDGKLFFSTDKADVVALDMATGQQLWHTQVAASTAGDTWSMTAGDGVVLSAAAPAPTKNNNLLVALNATNGNRMWTFGTTEDIYNVLPAIKDGSCVFSDSKGKVYRLHLNTGRVIWQTPTPQLSTFTTGGSVIGPNGVVYTTWNAGERKGMDWGKGMIGAYSFESGEKLWSTNVEYMANNGAAVGKLACGRLGVVVGIGENPDPPSPRLGIRDGVGPLKKARIVALDALTGEFLWTYQLPDWHGSALGDERRPDICLPDAFGNAAIGGDGTVYVGHASGLLYAVRPRASGGSVADSEVSAWQTGAAFQGTPAIAPGMFAAASCNGLHVWRF
mmetsp:Transcript_20096/g.55342  ORF Transcript_20096/g.55342 Transcript_20096/m.55342 type:complete len:470 (-) Transcript_20096:100-1509(-)